MLLSHSDRRCVKNYHKEWILCVSLASILALATGYNFDAKNIKVFEDPVSFGSSRESYFGFSTALYTGSGDDFAEASILVGAPRANVSAIPSVLEPGTVYKCRIKGTCVEWNLDPTTNGHVNRNPSINQIKDNAWIGATIGVENKTQPRVVVCGPRWKNNIINRNLPNWFMNGICYWSIARNAETFQKQADNRMIPLLGIPMQISSGKLRFYNYGMGQTGFSLHMHSSNVRSDLLLGNPGVFNWKGAPSLTSFFSSGVSYQTIPEIGHEPLIHSGDYFGYSVSSGCYFEKYDLWYASGAPRGADMLGRVLIFRFAALADKRLVVNKVLDGEQHGEYFGASLASCDINNDGRDEIIVGAPQWSKHMEEGRVYAYIVKSNGEFEPQYLGGEAIIGGRFGAVVTCLGDLDYDGYGDIAVGAPYENDHGAIYIYNGNSNGLSKAYTQRIVGESISQGIRGFGASISEPRDIDGNAYSDVAVGAYLSGHVVLLRSQPVVTMIVSVTHGDVKELQSNSTFFVANVCSFYDGSHVPDHLSVERILRVDTLQGRAFFGDSRNTNGTYVLPDTLHRGKHACDQLRINLVRDIQNVVDYIELSVSLVLADLSEARLTPIQWPADKLGENKFCPQCPVVNQVLSKTEGSITLPFAVDCGSDNVCSSILDLSITGDLEKGNRYTLGSKPTVKLMVGVANRGEPAYKAQAHIYVPAPIALGSLAPECTENSRLSGILEIMCELGNPLRDQKNLVLELDMSRVLGDSSEVNLVANLTTQSVNLNSEVNTRNFTIHFDVDADIAIAGKSQDVLYSYFNKEDDKKLEVIRFQHIYEVQKFGKSPIEESILTVLVPMHWNDEGYGIEIARINQIFGLMEGRQFFCTDSERSSNDEVILTDSLTMENRTKIERTNDSRNRTFERFSIEETPTLSIPPDNRTIYLNCTNPTVKCTSISCKLGTFANSLTVAKLTITLDLQLRNFRPEAMEARDIVFFVSNGTVSIKQPGGIIQSLDDKPDSALVGTTFVGAPIASGIAIWIVVLSVLLGILLLILLTLGLIRFGFFHRKKREELEALKAESDKNHGFVLETSSSRENLDRD